MAITPTYEHNNDSLKKLTLAPVNATYWLKDADLRAVVESFGSAVYKDVVTTFNASGVDIATEAATAAYIQDVISRFDNVLHFIALVQMGSQTDPVVVIRGYYTANSKVPAKGDVIIIDNGKEFVCTDQGTGVADSVWEEFGDQNIYLTTAAAEATYVPKTRTIAGIDLQDNITIGELSASTALDLKALAHKDSASGSVEVLDTIANISSGKAGEYNVTDQSTVSVPQTFNALDVTPAGEVSISAGTAAAVNYDKTTSIDVTSSAADATHTANYTPSGNVSVSAGTAAAANYDKTSAVAITVATPDGSNPANYTPSGNVSVSADTAAAANYDKTSAVAIVASTPDASHTANYTPSGSISLPSLSPSLSSTSVATVTDGGTAYTLNGGSVSKATDTTAKFVKKGVSFSVDSNTETLSLAYVANTDTEFYTDAVTEAGGVTYTSPTLSGALPTFGTQEVALATGASVSYDGSASFSGDGAVLGTSITHTSTAAEVTQPTFTASFSGDGAVLGTSITHTSTAAEVTQPTFTASFSGDGAVIAASANSTSTAAEVTQPTFTASFTGTANSVTPTAATSANAAAVGGKVTVDSESIAIVPTKKTVTVTVS